MTTTNTDQEKKAIEGAFNKYRAKTIYPKSVNQLDFNAGYDSQEKKIQELKELLCEAKPWVIEIKYGNALNQKPYHEQVEWQKKYEEVMR